MSCLVNYRKGNPIGVNLENNQAIEAVNESVFRDNNTHGTSLLFDNILKVPAINNAETSLEIYKNIYAKSFVDKFGQFDQNIEIEAIDNNEYLSTAEKIATKQLAKDMSNPIVLFKGRDGKFTAIGGRINAHNGVEGQFFSEHRNIADEYGRKTGTDIFVYDNVNEDTIDLDKRSGLTLSQFRVAETNAINESEGDLIRLNTIDGTTNAQQIVVKDMRGLKQVSGRMAVTEISGEPKMFFKTPNGTLTTSYKEALEDTETGQIEIGFVTSQDVFDTTSKLFEVATNDVVAANGNVRLNNSNAFTTVAKVSADSSPNTVQGFINQGVRNGTINEQLELVDGALRIKGAGATEVAQVVSVQMAQAEAVTKFGSNNVTLHQDYTLEVTEPQEATATVLNADGTTSTTSIDSVKEELKNRNAFEKLNKKIPNLTYKLFNVFLKENDLYKETETKKVSKERTKDLRLILMNTLSKLGISVEAMSSYLEKFGDKHDSEPSVKALADIANKIVALAEGSSIEDLAEETAHFLIEAFEDQNALLEVMPLVINTKQYTEQSAKYYEKYGDKYKGTELDYIVQREILGKILKDKIMDNFDTSTQTQQENTITQRLRQLFNNFVNKVKQLFRQEQRTELDYVLDEIADQVLNEELGKHFDTSLLEQNTLKLYSVADKKILSSLVSAQQKLTNQLKQLKASKSASSFKVGQELKSLNKNLGVEGNKTIKDINDEINTNNSWLAVQNIVSAVNAQTKYISGQLAHYKEMSEKDDGKTAYFTLEEQQIYKELSEDWLPVLEELRTLIKGLDTVEQVNSEDIANNIDSAILGITGLNGDVKVQGSQDKGRIIQRIMNGYNLPESERVLVQKYLDDSFKDINFFTQKYGSLSHAGNSYLNLLGKIIADVRSRVTDQTTDRTHEFLKLIEEQGWKVSDFEKILVKDENGQVTGFTESPFAFAEYMKAEKQMMVDAYKEVLGEAVPENLSVENLDEYIRDKKVPKRGDLSVDNRDKFTEISDSWYKENTERRYKDEWYKKRDELYKDYPEAATFLNELSTARFHIKGKYYTEDGKYDDSEMPKSEREALTDLVLSRKAAKSLFDVRTGAQKTGEELALAQGLQAIDEKLRLQREEEGQPAIREDFYETLAEKELEGADVAFEWLLQNGGITFNEQFWDGLKNAEGTLIERLRKYSDRVANDYGTETSEIFENDINELEEKLNLKKELLKQFQVPNNPAEVDATRMESATRALMKETEAVIQEKLRTVNATIKPYTNEEVTIPTIATENTVNMAYEADLAQSGLNELAFIKRHTTNAGQDRIRQVEVTLANIAKGRTQLDYTTINFIKKLKGVSEVDVVLVNKVIEEMGGVNAVAIEYGKTQLLSYYQRFAPKGYDTFLQQLKSGQTKLSDFMDRIKTQEKTGVYNEGVEGYLTVQAQYHWNEENAKEEDINPNYVNNFIGGMRQPKVDKYLDNSFFEKYGVDKDNYLKTGKIVGTRNTKQLDMLNTLWDLKRQGLELYEEAHTQNAYMIPQYSKSTTQRLSETSKSPFKTAWNAIKDITMDRVDDIEYANQDNKGNVEGGSQMKKIPKTGIMQLENANDQSTQLAESYTKFIKSALTYKANKEAVTDVMVLRQALSDTETTDGKDIESSRVAAMYDEFTDNYFYGITRNRKKIITLPNGKKMDVSKLAMAFDKFVRVTNIGFSVPIALTAATSSVVFEKIEAVVGEHTDKNSASWAGKEFRKLASAFIADTGKVNKENKLYVFGETFRIYNVEERTASSGYNRAVRALNNLPYKFAEVATKPVAPKAMLATLDNMRLVGDQFMDYHRFKDRSELNGKTEKEKIAEWNNYRDQSMYNLMEIKNGKAIFNEAVQEQFSKEYLDSQIQLAQTRIREINANVDAVVPSEDKSSATRDFLLKFTTAHRGWLTINIQRRFKRAHFNFATGRYEEGHYITLGKQIGEAFKNYKANNYKDMIKVIKETYNTLEPHEQRNLKRVAADASAYAMLLMLGIVVAGLADDPDNKDLWAVQLASYIYFRTVSEVGSAQLPTGATGIIDTLQSPFIALNTIKEILDVKGWSLEEVSSGAYEGDTKLYRKLMKITWGRHVYDLGNAENIKSKSDYYRLLNSETLLNLAR